MRKYIFTLFIAAFLLCNLYSRDEVPLFDSFTLNERFYPADEGSGSQAKLLEYLEKFCTSRDVEYELEKIASNEYVTNSYNFIVRFKGTLKGGEKRVFVFPLNSRAIHQEFCGCSLSTYVALSMIDECSRKKNDRDVIIIFSGANGREKGDLYGLQHLVLHNKELLSGSLFTIVDIASNADRILFSGSINKQPLSAGLLRLFIKTKPDFQFFSFDYSTVRKARLNLLKHRKEVELFLSRDIPAVLFSNLDTDFQSDYIFVEENEKVIKDYFLTWMRTVSSVSLEMENDYNYLYFNLLGIMVVIPEYFQILFFVSVLFLLIFLRGIFLYFNRTKVKLLLRVLPFFLIIFVFFYLTSFIPRILLIPFEYFTGDRQISNNIPSLYFIIIFCTPVILGLILFDKIQKLPFPKHNFLYIYGAVLFCYCNFFIFTILDFSITYMFVWAIILLTLSHVIEKRIIMKYGLYLLSVVPFLLLYVELSVMGNISLVRKTFDFPLRQHMLFCLITFPFFLLIIRIELMNRIKFKKFFHSKNMFLVIMVMTLIITLMLYIFISAYVEPERKILTVDYLFQSSPGGPESSVLTYEGGGGDEGVILVNEFGRVKRHAVSRKSGNIEIQRLPMPFQYTLKTEERPFSIKYRLFLTSDNLLDTIDCYIVCPPGANPLAGNFIMERVLDENVLNKYCQSPDCQVYKLLIPRNSGKEVEISFELLPGEQYSLLLEVAYPLFIPGKSIRIFYPSGLVYTRSRFLKKFYLE